MVSGIHSKTYDINKIHEFIDNLTFPTERSTPTYREAHQRLQQKKLFDELAPTQKKIVRPPVHLTALEGSAPQVVTPPKVATQKQEATVRTQQASPTPDSFFPKEVLSKVEQQQETLLPEFEPVDETPTTTPQDHSWLPSYEPLEIESIWDKDEHKKEGPIVPKTFEELPPETTKPEVPREAPEPTHPSPREERREQRLRQKELKKRLRLEQKATKRHEREQRRQEKQEQKQRRSESLPKYKEPRSRWQRQNQILKDARKQERLKKQQEKLIKKNDLISTGLREDAYKRKLMEDKRLKKIKEREQKHDNAYIISKKAPQPTRQHTPAPVPEQYNKEYEQQIAQETEERRTLKEIEHDLQKEKEKKEKEAQKVKAIEEENAKKIMEARYEEERLKQQHGKPDAPIDVFNGFDSIDQATALTLNNHGYTTVARLLSASLEDLMKIGIKKKIANLICAETKEFVEWKVFDAKDQPEPVSKSADEDEETQQ